MRSACALDDGAPCRKQRGRAIGATVVPAGGDEDGTPGRYVGAEAAEDDDEPFDEKMKRLTATLREQQAEAAKLGSAIAASLKELGYGS